MLLNQKKDMLKSAKEARKAGDHALSDCLIGQAQLLDDQIEKLQGRIKEELFSLSNDLET